MHVENWWLLFVHLKQDAFYKISSREGMKSLWSGLSPTLVLAVPATIVYFVCYEEVRINCKDYYLKMRPGETEQHFVIPLLAGVAARVFSVTIVSPLELIRTKMQSQKLSYYGESPLFERSASANLFLLLLCRCRKSIKEHYCDGRSIRTLAWPWTKLIPWRAIFWYLLDGLWIVESALRSESAHILVQFSWRSCFRKCKFDMSDQRRTTSIKMHLIIYRSPLSWLLRSMWSRRIDKLSSEKRFCTPNIRKNLCQKPTLLAFYRKFTAKMVWKAFSRV